MIDAKGDETMATYTILNGDGSERDHGLSLRDAAVELLTADGHEYEIRPEADGDGFRLWTSLISRNSGAWHGLTASVIFSLRDDQKSAEVEIFGKVVKCNWFKATAMTDEAYDRMLAE